MKKRMLLLCLAIFFCLHSLAWAFGEQHVAFDANGDILALVFTSDDDNDYQAVIKYNVTGERIWEKKFTDERCLLAVDDDGGFVLASGKLIDYESKKLIVRRYNADGDLLWKTTLAPENDDESLLVVGVSLDDAGNIYIGMNTIDDGDVLLAKFDADGVLQWDEFFDGLPELDNGTELVDMTVDGEGNLILAGYVIDEYNYGLVLTAKLDTSGALQWRELYQPSEFTFYYAQAVAVNDGGIIGVAGSAPVGHDDPFLILAYDADGNELLARRYGGAFEGQGRDVAVDAEGNVYATGFITTIEDNLSDDLFTVKMNTTGAEVWQSLYDGPDMHSDSAWSIVLGGSGELYVTGIVDKGNITGDYLTMRYDADGQIEWTATYEGPWGEREFARDIDYSPEGYLAVFGEEYDFAGEWGYVIEQMAYTLIVYDLEGNELWSDRFEEDDFIDWGDDDSADDDTADDDTADDDDDDDDDDDECCGC